MKYNNNGNWLEFKLGNIIYLREEQFYLVIIANVK